MYKMCDIFASNCGKCSGEFYELNKSNIKALITKAHRMIPETAPRVSVDRGRISF